MAEEWHRQRTWLRRHPVAVDVGLTLLAMSLGLLSLWDSAELRPDKAMAWPDAQLTPVRGVLTCVAVLPLLLRRRYPFVTAFVLGTFLAVLGLTGTATPGVGIATLIAVYTIGASRSTRTGIALLAGLTAVSTIVLASSRGMLEDVERAFFGWLLLLNVLGTVGAWSIGRAVQSHRAYLDELEERATRLERTRTAEVRAALAEERSRMARELHDVVAHHVSVMTVQAAAARRTLERAPDRSVEAMLAVEETGRGALGEMRRIVGALRAADDESQPGDPAHIPQPGIADLQSLIERGKDAGLDVDLRIAGTPVEGPTGVELAVYRVVQEALTNILKHAGPTRAAVLLRYGEDGVVVRITDDGRRDGQQQPPDSPDGAPDGEPPIGHGLVGMRERVMLNGGTLSAGRRLRGGFEVVARFPMKETTT